MTKDTQPHPDQGPAMKSNDHPNLPDWAQAIGNPSADVDMLHKQALADIKERGETPAALLGSLAGMMAPASHRPDQRSRHSTRLGGRLLHWIISKRPDATYAQALSVATRMVS